MMFTIKNIKHDKLHNYTIVKYEAWPARQRQNAGLAPLFLLGDKIWLLFTLYTYVLRTMLHVLFLRAQVINCTTAFFVAAWQPAKICTARVARALEVRSPG